MFRLLSLLSLTLALSVALAASGGDCPRQVWTPVLAQARVATLRNDQPALRNFFQIVASREDLPGLSDQTRGLSRDPRIRAAKPGTSDVMVAAAGALGEIGGACGSCHKTRGKGPTYEPAEAPEIVDDVVAHMARHQWAVDRMWEGLMAPSDERWALGVNALHDHPLDAQALTSPEAGKSPADYLDWWIHQRGPDTATAAAPEQRGKVYADLMAACAACHAETQGAPRAP